MDLGRDGCGGDRDVGMTRRSAKRDREELDNTADWHSYW